MVDVLPGINITPAHPPSREMPSGRGVYPIIKPRHTRAHSRQVVHSAAKATCQHSPPRPFRKDADVDLPGRRGDAPSLGLSNVVSSCADLHHCATQIEHRQGQLKGDRHRYARADLVASHEAHIAKDAEWPALRYERLFYA
jgi:hypothetical protein